MAGAAARRRCSLWPVVAAVLVVRAPAAARADEPDLAAKVQAVLDQPGDPVQAGIWFGPPSGPPLYQRAAGDAIPAASVIKSAVLIELFAAHAGHLDEPLGVEAILADDKHPAIAPFSASQRADIRRALGGATVRTVGAIMMGSKPASNAVYNAAANLAIGSLGGPAEATAKIRARSAEFAGLVVHRYMLAPRAGGDNEVTPQALASALAAIATGKVPGELDAATVEAMAQIMIQENDKLLGPYRLKEGNLDSDPMVHLKTGFFVRKGKPIIFVIGIALSGKPKGGRDAAGRRLEKLTEGVFALLRTAASGS